MNKINRARRLRQDANAPEQRAWMALRALRRHGWPVRRQHPVGPYFADFAIVSARLVIEIDGAVHRLRTQRDAVRDQVLRALGWRVLRLSAADAMSPDRLMALVVAALPKA